MFNFAKSIVRFNRLWLCSLLALPLVIILIAIVSLMLLQRPMAFDRSRIVIEVKKHTSLQAIVNQLSRDHVLPYPHLTYWTIKLNGLSKQLKAGEYEIRPSQTTMQFLQALTAGDVYFRSMTLIEGWRFDQLRQAMNRNPYLRHDTTNLSVKQLKRSLGVEASSLEGLFYPDTYFFLKGESDLNIYKRAHLAMNKLLRDHWAHRQDGLPYRSPYAALIVASLIEKETAQSSEKPMISGVIVKRLKKRMRLQIDPTVVYALGKQYHQPLTRKNLKVKSPYNTYRHYGLPPSPIAIPGRTSIQAALHPKLSVYLYYLAKHDGTHVFSSSLRAHQKAYKTHRKGHH